MRKRVLHTALVGLDLIAPDAPPDELGPALAAFETHSQAGSARSGAKKAGIAEADAPLITECVAKALEGLAGVTVEADGANVVLPGSLK